jgi:hypothetical protein
MTLVDYIVQLGSVCANGLSAQIIVLFVQDAVG